MKNEKKQFLNEKQKISLFILSFKNILSNCDWEALYSENPPDIAYNDFIKIFSKTYDTKKKRYEKFLKK